MPDGQYIPIRVVTSCPERTTLFLEAKRLQRYSAVWPETYIRIQGVSDGEQTLQSFRSTSANFHCAISMSSTLGFQISNAPTKHDPHHPSSGAGNVFLRAYRAVYRAFGFQKGCK